MSAKIIVRNCNFRSRRFAKCYFSRNKFSATYRTAPRLNALDQRCHAVQQCCVRNCDALALDGCFYRSFCVCDACQFSLNTHVSASLYSRKRRRKPLHCCKVCVEIRLRVGVASGLCGSVSTLPRRACCACVTLWSCIALYPLWTL